MGKNYFKKMDNTFSEIIYSFIHPYLCHVFIPQPKPHEIFLSHC